jgi:hypothetical protein
MYACSSVLKDSPEDVSRQAEAQSRDEQIIRDRAALPEINVTADQLARAFDADWDSALRKYYDRRLRVTGPVRQVLNDSAISLGTVTSVKRVHASFKSTSGVSSLVRGQVVTVQCIGDDYVLGIVALRECSLAR